MLKLLELIARYASVISIYFKHDFIFVTLKEKNVLYCTFKREPKKTSADY